MTWPRTWVPGTGHCSRSVRAATAFACPRRLARTADRETQEDQMYRWIVFIHIASGLGLLLVHPVTGACHLKEERNDTRIRELLEVSEAASTLRWVVSRLTMATGQ